MVDPETTRAVAKATEETAKTTGKAFEIVHDAGGYLRQVFGDLVINGVGWLIGDWVAAKRERNFDALCRRTMEILHERDVEAPIELSPNQATELLTAAQDESREELAELWARLLANAMDPNLNSVRHSFITSVKNMDRLDAVVLRYIHEENIASIHRGREPDRNANPRIGIEDISIAIGRRSDEVEVSIRHLQALFFFDGEWSINANSREFLRACYPEVKTK
jgi:hypothetical protein